MFPLYCGVATLFADKNSSIFKTVDQGNKGIISVSEVS